MMQNKKRLRVAMLGSYPADPGQVHGGVQAAYTSLVSRLIHMEDLDLHMLTFQWPNWDGPDRFERDGLTIHLLPPFPSFERLRGYSNYQKILNNRLIQICPQVIHTQEGAADAYVALRSGYPTVVTIHGIRNEDRKYLRSWSQRIRFFLDSFLTERRVVSRSRYLIAISRYVAKYFGTRFRPDIRCFFIPNAVEERFFELKSATSIPKVLFAGRVIPLKRVMDLVQAFERVIYQIPDAQLNIAGDCHTDPIYARTVLDYVQQAGLEKNVFLLGELKQEGILQEYAECSLLVLPSAQENAPMVIAQAMAAGKPVIATPVGGVSEMIGKDGERGVLVPVGNINSISGAILDLMRDPTRRERMGQAGRRFAMENYYPAQVAKRTAEVYREIVAREGGLVG